MNAEILAVGTELLLGQIVNTNAQRISASLASIGVDVFRHSVVGDNRERLRDAISAAAGRSDAVIITGGLGPTPDDLTREALADALGRPLRRDEDLESEINGIFERLGRPMPDSNLRQADLPEGATPIPPEGTAPGFHLEHDGCLIVALPGVPWEMEAMLATTVLPLLRARAGDGVTVSRHVLVIGIGESHTHENIADLVAAQTNPTIAYLASAGQVRVRLTAKAASEPEAVALITPVEDQIRARLGQVAVPGNHDSIADALAVLLREKGLTVAAAESLTGGLIGAELTRAAGASDYFTGTLVCYTNEAKRDVVGVPESVLAQGSVTEEVAGALAEGAARVLGADLGIAATGVAGPTEHEGMPVGTILVGAAFGGRTEVRRVRGYGDRDNVRAIAVTAALDLGRRLVQG